MHPHHPPSDHNDQHPRDTTDDAQDAKDWNRITEDTDEGVGGADDDDPFADHSAGTDDAVDPLEAARLAEVDERDELDYWQELARSVGAAWTPSRLMPAAWDGGARDAWLDADWLDDEDDTGDAWLDFGEDDDDEDDDEDEDDALMDDVDDWNALDELEQLEELERPEHPRRGDPSDSAPAHPDAPAASDAPERPPRLARDPLAMLCALDAADARRARANDPGAPGHRSAVGHTGAHGTPVNPRPHGSFAALQALVRAPRPPWAGNGNGHASGAGNTTPSARPLAADVAGYDEEGDGDTAADMVADAGANADGDTSGGLTAAELDAVCHTLASAATNVGLLAFALARPDMLPGSGWSARHGVIDAHPRLHAAFGLIQALFDFEDAVGMLLRTLGLEEDDQLPPHPRAPRHSAATPRAGHNDISGNGRQGSPT